MKNLSVVKEGIIKTTSRVGLKLSKHSPEILMVAGIAGFIGTVVLACRATTRVGEVLDEHDEFKEAIDTSVSGYTELNDEGKMIEFEPMDPKEAKKAYASLYFGTGFKLVKLYSPAIILGTTSTVMILCGHNILKKRFVGVMAAYSALDQTFRQYRDRVIDKYGEEADEYFRTGIEKRKIEVVTTDEKGKNKVEKEVVDAVDNLGLSPYARIFEEGNVNYTKSNTINRSFIEGARKKFQHDLDTRGHVFLNEVYQYLGFEHTPEGAVVGWLKNGDGDGVIDFITRNVLTEADVRFVNGYEPAIWLDFNVDGVIWKDI